MRIEADELTLPVGRQKGWDLDAYKRGALVYGPVAPAKAPRRANGHPEWTWPQQVALDQANRLFLGEFIHDDATNADLPLFETAGHPTVDPDDHVRTRRRSR